jgi:ubiquinone/menaquinone biosynthesis C-methylase UbiE
MTEPTPDRQQIAGYYDRYSTRYEAERRRGYFEIIHELEFEKVRPLAGGTRTLEVGCGTGLMLERVHQVAADARGVDISTGMLEVARAKGLNAVIGSATDLPFPEESFDLVYSFQVLAHVPDIRKALAEMARVTKPEGRMVLEFYNPYSLKGCNDLLLKLIGRNPGVNTRHDTLGDVRSYLAPCTEIVSVRGIRIFGLVAACYTLPGISKVYNWLERAACDSFLKRMAGFMVVEIAFGQGSRPVAKLT